MPEVKVTDSCKATSIKSDSFRHGFWYALAADFSSNKEPSYLFSRAEDLRGRYTISAALLRLDTDNGIISIIDNDEDMKFSPEPVARCWD